MKSKAPAFGPQTQYFATLLSRAEHITREQRLQMENLRTAESDEARKRAWESMFTGEVNLESMTTAQFLDMYSNYYPQSILDAALAVATRHNISVHDYQVLSQPWDTVVGKVHPED